MSRPQRLVCSVIEAWVRLYTLGLAAGHRADRIDLIRADLHDQFDDAGGSPSVSGVIGAASAACQTTSPGASLKRVNPRPVPAWKGRSP